MPTPTSISSMEAEVDGAREVAAQLPKIHVRSAFPERLLVLHSSDGEEVGESPLLQAVLHLSGTGTLLGPSHGTEELHRDVRASWLTSGGLPAL